jgi:hypothetical protein
LLPGLPLTPVCFRASVASRIHFPASLGSTGVSRFSATTDALTSAGRLFGLCRHEHRSDSARKFAAYSDPVSCHSISKHVMCAFGRFLPGHPAGFFPPASLACSLSLSTASPRSLGSRSRFRVYRARSPVTPHRIEFTVGASRPLALRTGHSLSVAFHGRITPPQLLSTTGPVNFGLTGTFTPLRCLLHSRT